MKRANKLQLFAAQGALRTDGRRDEGKQSVTGKVRCAAAPIRPQSGGAPKLSPRRPRFRGPVLFYWPGKDDMSVQKKNKKKEKKEKNKVMRHFSVVDVRGLGPCF